MRHEPLPVRSPYLAQKMAEVMGKTGWSIQEIAEKSQLSYGYARRIVNGTVVPNRDALIRLCAGLGLDFVAMWKAVQHRAVPPTTEGSATPGESAEFGQTPGPAPDTEDALCATRRKINSIMDGLPVEGMFELLRIAWTVEDKYNDLQNRWRETYNQMDEDGRRYRWEHLRTSEDAAAMFPEMTYALLGVEGHWRYPKERMEQLVEIGRVAIPPGGKEPRLKVYSSKFR